MAQTQAKQSEPQGKNRWRGQEGTITKAPPQLPDKEYVEKTRQIYLMAVERRLKRETILTGRQRDILICIVVRLSNKEIAEKLNMSRQRVDQHIAALLKKTGEKDKVGLVLWLLGFGSYANSQFAARVHAEMKRAGKPCDCPKCSSEAARSPASREVHRKNRSTSISKHKKSEG
jgi:DNA-binding CsgD family transcriptional regulator